MHNVNTRDFVKHHCPLFEIISKKKMAYPYDTVHCKGSMRKEITKNITCLLPKTFVMSVYEKHGLRFVKEHKYNKLYVPYALTIFS